MIDQHRALQRARGHRHRLPALARQPAETLLHRADVAMYLAKATASHRRPTTWPRPSFAGRLSLISSHPAAHRRASVFPFSVPADPGTCAPAWQRRRARSAGNHPEQVICCRRLHRGPEQTAGLIKPAEAISSTWHPRLTTGMKCRLLGVGQAVAAHLLDATPHGSRPRLSSQVHASASLLSLDITENTLCRIAARWSA